MTNCPWCDFNPGCFPGRCDFKNLPYDKQAIICRIQEEVVAIAVLKEKVLGEKNSDLQLAWMVDAIDKAKGIDIMSQRLVADFGMTMDEIKEEAPSPKMSWMDSMRVAMAMKDAQKRERGKTHGP